MLPDQYTWLLAEPGPRMLKEFLAIYGIEEVIGPGSNPVILSWATEIGVQDRYKHDAVPWCGLAMAVIAKRAGKAITFDPLWALNWARFGQKVNDGAKLGDVLVFKRSGGGHVGLYIGEDDECYHCGGGNQSDKVNIIRKPKHRIYAIRRPFYNNQPANVRRILLEPTGRIDNNEQ